MYSRKIAYLILNLTDEFHQQGGVHLELTPQQMIIFLTVSGKLKYDAFTLEPSEGFLTFGRFSA
jgi:hypothetical protein